MEDSYFGVKDILAKPRRFNMDSAMDRSIGKSISQKQKVCNCLSIIIKALSPRDWRSIFLYIANDQQIVRLFLEMLKRSDSGANQYASGSNDDVDDAFLDKNRLASGTPFWECLNNERRFRVWN